MINYDELNNHIFDLESIQLSSQNDLKVNWFFIKNIFIQNIEKDRLTVMYNSLINKKLLKKSEHTFIYRPDYFTLKVENLNLENPSDCNTYLNLYLVGLVELYLAVSLHYTDIRMKWIINTLIHYKILVNIFDTSNKTTNSFKELFQLQ